MEYIFVESLYLSLLYLSSHRRYYPPLLLPPPPAALELDAYPDRYNLIMERETSSIAELQAALGLEKREIEILLKR
jgi:hypothetical protein